MSQNVKFTFTFSHLAEAFIQSDLQMRTIEAIKPQKSNNMQVLWQVLVSLTQYTEQVFFFFLRKTIR